MNSAALPELDLRDIHAPPLPEFWPPAPGWWIAAVVVTGLLVFILLHGYRRYRLHRQCRQVLATLEGLAADYSEDTASGFVCGVSALLRRVALLRFPRRQVAALFGMEWCRFLDETGGNGAFCQGAGQVLATGPYTARVEVEPEQLIALAREWIRKNFGAGHEH